MICSFFYFLKITFQDFINTEKDIVSLLNRYLLIIGKNSNDLFVNCVIFRVKETQNSICSVD